ncbi:prepilin peptidase [Palleronia sediminis]|uniref:prepilin peptidase n=1 Tax=Palleronia sediminis TaxID=2547833 RepID=UPI001F100BB3|nr:prepilin peptidase [Palleronia sediminis]
MEWSLTHFAAGLVFPDRAALWLLPLVAPVCLWVAWTDLTEMKIRNLAVAILLAIYALVGPLVLPFEFWAWGWLNFAVILLFGFFANMIGGLGAGDAKFMAAAAPFIAVRDTMPVLMILSVMLLASFALHRAARGLGVGRRVGSGWVSWTSPRFPMGLALGPTLIVYLWLCALG